MSTEDVRNVVPVQTSRTKVVLSNTGDASNIDTPILVALHPHSSYSGGDGSAGYNGSAVQGHGDHATAFSFAYTSLTLAPRVGIAIQAGREAETICEIVTSHLAPNAPWRDVWSQYGGRKGYKEKRNGPLGTWVGSQPVSESRMGWSHHHLGLPDTCTEILGVSGLRQLFNELREFFDLYSTRLDLAFEPCCFTPRQLYETTLAGHCLTVCKIFENGKQTDSLHWHSSRSCSFYLGGVDSLCRLRVYDDRGPTRMELQLRSEKAQAVFSDLVLGNLEGPALAARAKGIVDGFVSFHEAKPGMRLARCPLQPWWSDFLGGATTVRLPG